MNTSCDVKKVDFWISQMTNRIYLSDGTDVTDKALAFVFDHLVKVHDGWLPMKQPSSEKVLMFMVADTDQATANNMAYKGEFQ
jgi:hypothetical protein